VVPHTDVATTATATGAPLTEPTVEPLAHDTEPARPIGRDAVRAALVRAATELIVERGLSISVRDIAARAGVNHGLVHTYFGSKDSLLVAAFDDINERAAAQRTPDGYPPVDLARRRNGEVARAIARVMLEGDHGVFGQHPVTTSWRDALLRDHPELSADEANEQVAIAATLGLGWALFADHFCRALGVDGDARAAADRRVAEYVHEIGGVPRADRR
jgi:AcrR family transcriptional regulator